MSFISTQLDVLSAKILREGAGSLIRAKDPMRVTKATKRNATGGLDA
jgi:hypothetical protein